MVNKETKDSIIIISSILTGGAALIILFGELKKRGRI